MTDRLWILGASDPEMVAIESLLRECGETVIYAEKDGQRVHPGNAYRHDPLDLDAFAHIQRPATFSKEMEFKTPVYKLPIGDRDHTFELHTSVDLLDGED